MQNKYNTSIAMSISPTFVSKRSSLEKAFNNGEYKIPTLSDFRKLLLSLSDSEINIYLLLSDEGLAVKGGSYLTEDAKEDMLKLELYSRTRDYSCLQ